MWFLQYFCTIFGGLPNPFHATRYHSLVVSRNGLPDCLEITARTADGVVMGLRHRDFPVEGVQFHPESILTEQGMKLLAKTEGVFTETAGGVTVGVTKKLIEQGRIGKDELTVISITGNGLKTQEAVMDKIGKPIIIEPRLSSFQKTFNNKEV